MALDTSGSGTLSLAMRDGHPLALAVRQGFWADDCALEATLTTDLRGGLAFRVQDKHNYFLVTPWIGGVRLWKVRDGAFSLAAAASIGSVNWTQPHRWFIRASGEDLRVAVEVSGNWVTAFAPAGNGQGVLADGPAVGGVGLATTGFNASAVICDSFTCGFDPQDTGAVADVAIAETFGAASLAVSPAYDAAGNLVDDGLYTYAYDAWNRLVRVQRTGPGSEPDGWHEIALYGYDGLGRRVRKTVSHSGDRNRQEYFYYNQRWQLLEIDDATGQAKHQFIWGQTYIDEPICMDVDTDDDGDCTDATGSPLGARRFFYCQDANYNVIALREGGDIVERYEYDPYGTVRIYKGWSTAAGRELLEVTGQSLKWLDADLPENPRLYCGYHYDSETGHYHVNHRTYLPQLGRWPQRDPGEPGVMETVHIGIAPRPAGGQFLLRAHVEEQLSDARILPVMSRSTPLPLHTGIAAAGTSFDDQTIDTASMYNNGASTEGSGQSRSNHQYRDGMNLYQYVKGNPADFTDPKGTDIYLKTGNTSGDSSNDAFHQKVCADWCDRRGKKTVRCFSFGKSGWAWFTPRRTWLGWPVPLWQATGGLYMMEGTIYPDEDNGTINARKRTTPQQDQKWVAWMDSQRVNTKDVYTFFWFNCRYYSQLEFADAPGNH